MPALPADKNVDISTFKDLNQPLRFKVKCPCGQITVSVIEKRRRYRKETDLVGTYVHYVNGQPKSKGSLRVKDLSTSGLKLMITSSEPLAVGDLLKVSFHLDNPQRSLIQKKVVVQNISLPYVGVEFAPPKPSTRPLGFICAPERRSVGKKTENDENPLSLGRG